MLQFSSDRFRRVIFFASIVGLAVGLAESLADILFGAIIDSRWVPGSFEFSVGTNILYTAFNCALYMMFLQFVGAFAAVVRIEETKSPILSRFPKGEALPYWLLACAVVGVAIFGNVNQTLWNEIELTPIAAIIGAQLVFIVLVVVQIRVFLKRADEAGPDDPEAVRRKNDSRTAAYIILAVASLFMPDLSEKLSTPLVRCISLYGILIFVYPLSWLIDKVLSAYRRNMSGKAMPARLASVLAVVAVLIPLCITLGLANYPVGVSIFNYFSDVPEEGSAGNAGEKPNVIILLIDMLRADHVHSYGYERETTPNIDKYAGEGVMFSNVRAQAAWTLPSTATLLSGLYPSTHGARGIENSMARGVETMAEVFQQNGYATAALVANPVLKRSYNINQGFDYYCDDIMSYSYLLLAARNTCLLGKSLNAIESTKLLFSNKALDIFNTPDVVGGYRLLFRPDKMGSETIHEGALKWIRKNPHRPFFLYLHYVDVHGPYKVQRPFDEDFVGRPVMIRMNLYDGALRYADAQIKLFIDELDRLGILDNSILFITSDHGHEFNEHGGKSHGYTLYEEQLQVPLIFLRTPAFPFNKVVSAPVGLIDIKPTLIAYLDLESPEKAGDGRDFSYLLGEGDLPPASEYQYAETELGNLHRGVIYKDRWKFITFEKAGVSKELLFDLSQDELEMVNLIEANPELASELRQKLNEAFSDYEGRGFVSETVELDEKARDHLRALGYLD